MSTMNRRAFLVRSGAGVAGLALVRNAAAQMRGGGGGTGGGGMGGGSTTVVDPPVGEGFRDPPFANEPGVLDVAIAATPATVRVGGVNATLLTYDGSFVAPTIRARRGDVVKLQFTNDLPPTTATNILGHPKNVTNVHVHGWHVSPGNNMEGVPADNVHLTVLPGATQPYEYDLRWQRPGTLALYHPHVHGTVAEQFWGGLVGALLVDDDASVPSIAALSSFGSHVVVLKDITLSAGEPSPYTSLMEYMHGKHGDLCTVNGQVNPKLVVRPGEVRRLRLLNASNARFYRLAIQGHTLHVIGTDGGLLAAPHATPELLLSPGERADVLVKASTTRGAYKLLALPYARQGSMTTPQITLMTLSVEGSRMTDGIPSVVDPAAARIGGDDPALRHKQFTLSMGQGRGYINGISFDVVDGSVVAEEHMSDVESEEIWTIVNQSGMDHPWHQHVNDGQVIQISGGDAAIRGYAQLMTGTAAWKDTIVVPKWGSVTLRLPIRHFTGETMYHCHILEHEDIGMMGMWHIMGPMEEPMGM